MYKKITKPHLIAMDLEGCLVPEIWVNLASRTKIDELSLTTRDINDYDVLMQKRLELLKKHKLSLADIQGVIAQMEPLAGAGSFLQWLRSLAPLVILSDTFYEFAWPLMQKLEYPALFCHTLSVEDGYIRDYNLRCLESKARSVRAFQENGFHVTAIGDSYNDITMLKAADQGILFHAPANIVKEYAQFPSHTDYAALRRH